MKKTFAGILIVTMFAPMLYMGMMPPREAEAAGAGLAGCLFGQLISTAISAGLGLISTAIGYIAGLVAPSNAAAISGAADAAGGTAVASGATGGAGLYVPVWESNLALLKAAGNTSTGAGSSALANLGSLGVDTVVAWINKMTSDSTMSLLFKECVLDPLAWLLKNIIIEKLAQDIMAWVANGFEGAPAFMTNQMRFMQDISDAAVGMLLFESGLDDYLCSPFKLNVVIDVFLNYHANNYSSSGNMACTLDNVFINVAHPELSIGADAGYNEVARKGNLDFQGGGLSAVAGMIQDKNNPYGTYFNLQSEAAARAYTFQKKENQLIVNANGWMSPRCDMDNDGVNDTVCTPGTWVAHQVVDYSNSSLKELEAADELAEVLDAVFAGLVKNILRKFNNSQGMLDGGSPQNWNGSQYQTTDAQYLQNYDQTTQGQQNFVNTGYGGADPYANVGTFAPGITVSAEPATNIAGNVLVTASLNNPAGVVGVQFLYDGINIGPEILAPAPFEVTGDSTTVCNGAYTLTAIARDANGNTETSPGLVVTVANGVDQPAGCP